MSDTPTSSTPGSVFEAIQTAIKNAHTSGKITDSVVSAFAERENTRRVKLLTDAFDKLTELAKAYGDINKPDNKTYSSADPSALPNESFTDRRRGEIAKAKKNVDELTKAISEALTNANYDGLEKALKKGGGGNQKKDSESED
jgi:hypothetical protein